MSKTVASGERGKNTNTERKPKSYKDLLVWQKSMALVKGMYRLTRSFPQDERFGLVSQNCDGRPFPSRPISPKDSRVLTLLGSSYSSFRIRKDLWPSWRHQF
jgi:hypothetical protein